ncbi:MAG TPA: hypothetical protein VLT47_09305 [Anaeromyxobacteraceae bacterium]|nr:hypothetical protein [Anaeromyxobacteraceae bacterium]
MAQLRERTLFVGGLLAMGAAVLLAWWLFFGRGPVAGMPAPGTQPPARTAPRVIVTRADGEAWLTRGGGGRTRLAAGTALQESDAIEAAGGSEVELGAGEGFQVLLEGPARIGVKEIAAELSRFRLEEGLAEAKVKPDAGRAVVFESSDDASVRTVGGRVAVAASGGTLAVGVTEGEAQLGSGGQIVAVRAGQQASAARGQAPTPPVPLPRSLLLKVDWPSAGETNRSRLVIRGHATPGALVSIGGEWVKVGVDGVFTHVLRLREGAQTVEAVARDLAGRRERSSRPVVLDTRGPDTRFDTEGLWGKDRHRGTSDGK